MKTAIIIPCRIGSTRLPGKPLLRETGKPLVQHTYEQAARARRADRVVVAADDPRILDAVKAFGGEAVMTRTDHDSGTDRVAEAARTVGADIILNVQGDEPEVDPAHLDALIDLQARAGAFCSTLACPFPPEPCEGPGSPRDPACVKALVTAPLSAPGGGTARRALYFTRALAPWPRDAKGVVQDASGWLLHIGVYGFSNDSLQRFARLPKGALSRTESLEQLRILEAGEQIAVETVSHAAPGIDTPEDYAAFVARQHRR